MDNNYKKKFLISVILNIVLITMCLLMLLHNRNRTYVHIGGGRLLTEHFTYGNYWIKPIHRILFIGNSITIHGLTNYWFGKWGMAATDAEHDYAHVYAKMLSKKYNVQATTCNFAQWETLAHDRAETFPLIDNLLLQNEWDEIVVQLGENISDASTVEKDFEELLAYIKKNNPKARLIILGNFWHENKGLNMAKQLVAKQVGAIYVPLDDLSDNTSYRLGNNKEVHGDDGKLYHSNHDGVAAHPGNLGMLLIATHMYDVR